MFVANIIIPILVLILLEQSFLASAVKWELCDSENNSNIFYRFVENIYRTWQSDFEHDIYVHVKNIVFYWTFIKYAAELAHYQLGKNGGTEEAIFAMIEGNFNCPYRYDKALEEKFNKEFNTEIFYRQNPSLPREVIDQITLLTFSLAIQYLLNGTITNFNNLRSKYSFNNSKHTAEWQLDTLLSAYNKLSKNHNNSILYGIYSFGIFPGQARRNSPIYSSKEQIDNFNFVLELSEFSLTPYEVYEVLQTILNESGFASTERGIENNMQEKQKQKMPKVYEVVKHFFTAKINYAHASELLLNHALYHFAQKLYMVAFFNYSDFFTNYVTINNSYHDALNKLIKIIPFSKMEQPMSTLTLFKRHMDNYARITIETTNKYKALTQFSEVLLEYAIGARDNMREMQYIGRKKLNELKIVVELLQSINDNKLYGKFKNFSEIFNKESQVFFNKSQLNQLIQLFQQIIEDYGWTGTMPPLNFMEPTKENIPKFGQFLFNTLKNWSHDVKYDEIGQMLTFPSALNELLLGRFHALLKMYPNFTCRIGEQLDFVSSVQNIAEKIKFTYRRKAISEKVNLQFYNNFFLPLTICLSIYIENANLARQYLESFVSTHNYLNPDLDAIYFQTQMNDLNKKLTIKIPSWKLPFSNYMENAEQFRQKRTNQMLRFLRMAPHSISTYQILKAAHKFGEEEPGQIWIGRSDSELFIKVINYMREQNEASVEIQLETVNESCFLAQFVKLLIEKMGTANRIPKIEKLFQNANNDGSTPWADIIDATIANVILAEEKLCNETMEQSETEKYFYEHLPKFVKVITIDNTPIDNLSQIISVIVAEIENMRATCDWNYTKLFYLKGLEWHILKYFIGQMGAIDQKWAEIEELHNEWAKLYDEYFKDKYSVKGREFEEVIEKLINALISII